MTDLAEGTTVTLIVRDGKLVPTWWDTKEPGTNAFECGYDVGFLDGINLRYRSDKKKGGL